MSNSQNPMSPRTIIGIGIIVFALLLFLNNMGFHLLGVIIKNWPIALVIVGVAMLRGPFKQDPEKNRNPYLPHILIGLGVLFTLAQYRIFNFSFHALIGPAILIAIGLHFLRPGMQKRKRSEADDELDEELKLELDIQSDHKSATQTVENDSRFESVNILGGSEISNSSQSLTGGSLVCIMGGAEIDLREADCVGETIEIDILAIMGGAVIKVPPHWDVSAKALPLLGGVSNKTACLAEKLQMPKKRLIITGLAFMGGIEVRN